MLNKFSEKAQKIIALAESMAFDLGHSSVGSEHLLLSFLKMKENKLKSLLEEEGITYESICAQVVELFGKKNSKPFYMEYTTALKAIIDDSIALAKKKNEEKVSIETLSIAFLSAKENVAVELLNKNHVKVDFILEEIKKQAKRTSDLDSISDLINLNLKALKIPPILINREKELKNLMEVLLRKQKANAILIGEPGVGKTAMVEYLAHLININQVPEPLKNKNIYELDIASIIAGTKYRGEFEEKLKKILKKVKDDNNAIVFIDEIHNIIGAGGAEGAIDASNIIKPYLSRNDICIIGATTYDEYVKLFEKEKALERRFQIVKIEEPTCKQSVEILQALLPSFKKYHGLEIDESLMNDLIFLCDQYVFDRHFPDKAIDVLDMACVRCKNSQQKKLDKQKIIDIIEDNYKVEINIKNKAKALEESLNQELFGQEKAISSLCNQIRYIELGMNDLNRPLGVFLFVGATGVGKTESAKQIAKYYFGSENKYIKLDMSEYSEPASVTKLIGSPPGYVGFENQSLLVDHIRVHPHTVVVLDEVEKASRDVLDVFLNVFDEGYFYDAQKRKVDFTNSIIILTSNLGFSENMFHQDKVGFINNKVNMDDVKNVINRHFRPEFINRIDEIIYFDTLSEETCTQLAHRYFKEYNDRLCYELAEEMVIQETIHDQNALRYGARGIKRKVKKEIIRQLNQIEENKVYKY